MIQIENFEKIVTSLANNDRVQAIRIIEEEINKAKEQKHNNVVKRLKLLLQVVSSSSGRTGGASAVSGGYRSIQRYTSPRSNTLYQISHPSTKTSDVVLDKDNETLLARFMNEWRHIEQLSSHGLDPVNKLLLYGPPGTGKTMLANAIANELQYPLVVVFLDELISSYLGNTGKNR